MSTDKELHKESKKEFKIKIKPDRQFHYITINTSTSYTIVGGYLLDAAVEIEKDKWVHLGLMRNREDVNIFGRDLTKDLKRLVVCSVHDTEELDTNRVINYSVTETEAREIHMSMIRLADEFAKEKLKNLLLKDSCALFRLFSTETFMTAKAKKKDELIDIYSVALQLLDDVFYIMAEDDDFCSYGRGCEFNDDDIKKAIKDGIIDLDFIFSRLDNYSGGRDMPIKNELMRSKKRSEQIFFKTVQDILKNKNLYECYASLLAKSRREEYLYRRNISGSFKYKTNACTIQE